MSKLPEMPDFLNKKPQENIPNSQESIKPTDIPSSTPAEEPPPIPASAKPKKEIKKSFMVKAEKHDVSEEKTSIQLSKPTNSFKQKITDY